MKWLLLTVSAMAVLTVDSRGFTSGHKGHKLDNPTLGPDSPRPHYKLKKILPDGLNLVKQTDAFKAAQVMVHYEPRDQELPEVAYQTERGHLNMSNFRRSDLEENKMQSMMAVRHSRNCGIKNRRTRIVNGIATEENEYPWQVALVYPRNNNVYCGGSLINDRWVLTAAHCTVKGWPNPLVILGKHKTEDLGLKRYVRSQYIHHEFNSRTADNDFALLKLQTPLDLSTVAPDIRPVCLPSVWNNNQYENDEVVATGWGRISTDGPQPNVLQEVTLITMSNPTCDRGWFSRQILSSMICAENHEKGVCKGDSGGPLVKNVHGQFVLVGVSSFVSGYGCADPYEPSVFARVTDEIEWIHDCISGGRCPRL